MPVRGGRTLSDEERERVVTALRALRDRPEYKTQQKLADALGVSQQNIGKYMSGTAQPGMGTARAVARLLKVSETELLTGRTAPSSDTRLDAAPGWSEAYEEARERYPFLAEIMEPIGAIRSPVPIERVTVDLITDLAFAWAKVRVRSADKNRTGK